MSTSISLAFGVGMLATITPGGIPFALAAVGLGAIAAEPGERPLRARFSVAIAHGAVAGAVFAATLFAAAFAESLGLEVSDPVPIPALMLSAGMMILGIGLAVSRAHHQRLRSAQAPAVFGLAYAIVSLPGALPLLQGMVTQTDKSRGVAGVLGVAFLFCAGVVAALIAISLLATLVSMAIRRLGGAGTVLAGGLVAGAGLVAAAYWMPAVPDDVGERGGGLSDRLADSSGAVGQFIANYELGFALLLLVVAVAAFAAALRPRS
jgi:cytochrome c biogenesis protein CcdA